MGKERSAGLSIFRRLNSQIEYLLLRASEMSKDWTQAKGNHQPINFKLSANFRYYLAIDTIY